MSKVIEPSFSFKYIFLVLLTAVITSVVTIVFQKYQGNDKLQRVALTVRGGLNELNYHSSKESAVSVKYSLKNDTSEVKGYYRKLITITNTGKVGLENLKFKVICNNKNIILIPNPKFESYPKENNEVELKIDIISPYQNDVIIPLLNINEGVSISYEAYSKISLPEFDLNVSIRQKDLEVERINTLVVKEEKDNYALILDISKYIALGIILFTVGLSVIFYRIWLANPELRARHKGNFWTYWWNGF